MFEVYIHTSPNGKSYVGLTAYGSDFRWVKHVWDARNGSQFPLHRAIRKHGASSFSHGLLERVSTIEGAKRAEVLWIRELGTFAPGGYNATLGGEGVMGRVLSQESRDKIAAAMTGRKNGPHSEATKQKMSAKAAGRKHSPESRAKMSASQTGKKRAPEAVAKTTAANTGRRWSADQRARLSEKLKGRVKTPEHRAKLSAALMGRDCLPPESRARVTAANRGRKMKGRVP